MDRENRIEQMCQSDAMCLGDQPKEGTVAIETPGTAQLHNFEPRLVVPVKKLVPKTAGGVFIGEFEGFRAVPLHRDNSGELIR